jgi:DNA-binding CsgD family transcriptional regulator
VLHARIAGVVTDPEERARHLALSRLESDEAVAKQSLRQTVETLQVQGDSATERTGEGQLGQLGLHPGYDYGLTETERRVAMLVVAGLTNREVATQLFISQSLVQANLSRIYSKYGVRSWTELAAKVAERSHCRIDFESA